MPQAPLETQSLLHKLATDRQGRPTYSIKAFEQRYETHELHELDIRLFVHLVHRLRPFQLEAAEPETFSQLEVTTAAKNDFKARWSSVLSFMQKRKPKLAELFHVVQVAIDSEISRHTINALHALRSVVSVDRSGGGRRKRKKQRRIIQEQEASVNAEMTPEPQPHSRGSFGTEHIVDIATLVPTTPSDKKLAGAVTETGTVLEELPSSHRYLGTEQIFDISAALIPTSSDPTTCSSFQASTSIRMTYDSEFDMEHGMIQLDTVDGAHFITGPADIPRLPMDNEDHTSGILASSEPDSVSDTSHDPNL
ncbi:hypothetical protein FALBO_14904 [Fusarium albosuccineum]|uniref:Uncharacterized protein n=1 Tax=Fusarium albosuccineum TaxID=1237068 RepID=A0A8H4KZD5_9HYPO|nr:hypothetical protein FALBO_14904 [Fusarium albosuccineum]